MQDEWFEVLLPSLQLVPTAALPASHRDRAERMLGRLHLGNHETVVRQREAWYRRYTAGRISLDVLAEFAPLVARAVVKRQAAAEDARPSHG